MLANFPDFISFPLPFFPPNVQLSNPFHLVGADGRLYVTDGGRNHVWSINLLTRSFSPLTSFAPIPNPLPFGPPFVEAVPAGITTFGGRILVTLFRGFPFPPGASSVELIDPATGSDMSYITGLTTAIDLLAVKERGRTAQLVLQHSSGGPALAGPALLLRFANPTAQPTIVADCLTAPSAMIFDSSRNRLYVTELTGRLVAVPIHPVATARTS